MRDPGVPDAKGRPNKEGPEALAANSALRHAGRSAQCREPVGGQGKVETGSRLLLGVAWSVWFGFQRHPKTAHFPMATPTMKQTTEMPKSASVTIPQVKALSPTRR